MWWQVRQNHNQNLRELVSSTPDLRLSIDELIKKAAGTDDLTEAEAIIILNTPFGDCTPEDQKEMTNQFR
jgi:hypothetical protein